MLTFWWSFFFTTRDRCRIHTTAGTPLVQRHFPRCPHVAEMCQHRRSKDIKDLLKLRVDLIPSLSPISTISAPVMSESIPESTDSAFPVEDILVGLRTSHHYLACLRSFLTPEDLDQTKRPLNNSWTLDNLVRYCIYLHCGRETSNTLKAGSPGLGKKLMWT